MKHIVYLTTNLVNSKKYIGVHQTDDPETFDGCGIYAAHRIKNPDTPFQKAVLKYGAESFRRETLFIFEDRDEAYEKEHELVNIEWISRDDTYNVAIGVAWRHQFRYINMQQLVSISQHGNLWQKLVILSVYLGKIYQKRQPTNTKVAGIYGLLNYQTV